MDDRYERAGTIGFRCAADLPASETARPCSASSAKACGTFDAPDAFTTLTGTGVKDWATYGKASSMASGSGHLPVDISSLGGDPEVVPTACPQLTKSATFGPSSGNIVPPPVVSAGVV